MTTHRPPFEVRGHHVLAGMIAFFALIIAVNVAFSVLAIRSFPGEDVKRSYLQGLNFNATLQDRARQAALGWQATADVSGAAGAAEVTVRLQSATAAPLAGLRIEGVLRRTATTREDRVLTFVEQSPGVYSARAGNIGEGLWMLRATAMDGPRHLDIERRLQWTAR